MREVLQGQVVRVNSDLGDREGRAVAGGAPVQVLHTDHRGADGRACGSAETRDGRVLEIPRDASERPPRR